MDKLPHDTDKLLSDKYILAKDIRDLNKTLLNAVTEISDLEDEVKNKVKLKDQLEQYFNVFDKSLKNPDFLTSVNKASTDLSFIEELIEKLNTEPFLQKLQENIEDEKNDFLQVKQLLIDNIHQLTDEIKIIGKRIKDRNDAISNVVIEKENLKAQMKDIIEEIVGYKI